MLLFGAVASVWGYNRFGDILVHLSRTLFWAPTLHYVDDYGGIEPAATADSAFQSFADLNTVLGMKTKDSKAQPPASSHRVQGVEITISDTTFTAAPTATRVAKMLSSIHIALTNSHLDSHTAARMAGKLGFLGTTTFGKLGRAPTKALFGRQHHPGYTNCLTRALRSSLRLLQLLLHTATPKRRPLQRQRHPHRRVF